MEQFSPRLAGCLPKETNTRETLITFLIGLQLRSCRVLSTYFDSPRDFAEQVSAAAAAAAAAAVCGAARADVAAGTMPRTHSQAVPLLHNEERIGALTSASFPERRVSKRARKLTYDQNSSHRAEEKQQLQKTVEQALALAEQLSLA